MKRREDLYQLFKEIQQTEKQELFFTKLNAIEKRQNIERDNFDENRCKQRDRDYLDIQDDLFPLSEDELQEKVIEHDVVPYWFLLKKEELHEVARY